MAKTTKFLTFTLDFGSKLGFLKVNISKTAQETCPQNFTMIFTCLTLLKNGVIIFGGVFFLRFWLNLLQKVCQPVLKTMPRGLINRAIFNLQSPKTQVIFCFRSFCAILDFFSILHFAFKMNDFLIIKIIQRFNMSYSGGQSK